MTLKLNWSNGIWTAILIYVALMGFLVYQSVTTRYELVSPEYYKEELNYQKIIDARNRTGSLSSSLTLLREEGSILIRLPEEFKGIPVKGTVYFYCATDAQKDKTFPLLVNAEALMRIENGQLRSGTYTVKVSWESREQSYYAEHSFNQ